MKTVVLGGLVALSVGLAAGAASHDLVGSVVSTDAGSRLELASVTAPPPPSPWAEGDASAPQFLLASTLDSPFLPSIESRDIVWTTQPEPPTEPADDNDALPAEEDAEPATDAAIDAAGSEADVAPEPATDFLFEPDAEAEPRAPQPDPELTVAIYLP